MLFKFFLICWGKKKYWKTIILLQYIHIISKEEYRIISILFNKSLFLFEKINGFSINSKN